MELILYHDHLERYQASVTIQSSVLERTRNWPKLIVLQGMITIVLECVDRLNVYNTAAHFSEFAGEEAAESWKEIVNLLYELLGENLDAAADHRNHAIMETLVWNELLVK